MSNRELPAFIRGVVDGTRPNRPCPTSQTFRKKANLKEVPDPEISGLIEDLRRQPRNMSRENVSSFLDDVIDAFDTAWEKGKKYFLVFLRRDSNDVSVVTLDHHQDAQNFVDRYLKEKKSERLLMAYDVEATFEEQFPADLYETITGWNQISLACINKSVLPESSIFGTKREKPFLWPPP